MQVQVVFRHMNPSVSLREYAEKKLSRLRRMADKILDVQVIYNQEKLELEVEFRATLHGHAIKVVERSADAYAATDLAIDKFERQIRRTRERRRERRSAVPAEE